jgi:hypothetical protein
MAAESSNATFLAYAVTRWQGKDSSTAGKVTGKVDRKAQKSA